MVMPMPQTQPMRTDDRSPSEIDPGLHVTLPPMDAGVEGADAMAAHGDDDGVMKMDASMDMDVDTAAAHGDAGTPMPPKGHQGHM